MIAVNLRPLAEADLDSARQWYDEQLHGLGDQFLVEVQLALDRIAEFPQAAVEVDFGARRALVSRFPFGIFYLLESSEAHIVAVMHLHRDPESWHSRVET